MSTKSCGWNRCLSVRRLRDWLPGLTVIVHFVWKTSPSRNYSHNVFAHQQLMDTQRDRCLLFHSTSSRRHVPPSCITNSIEDSDKVDLLYRKLNITRNQLRSRPPTTARKRLLFCLWISQQHISTWDWLRALWGNSKLESSVGDSGFQTTYCQSMRYTSAYLEIHNLEICQICLQDSTPNVR